MTEKRFTSEDYFMGKTKWELKLCNNGLYYVWQNNELYIQKDNGEYILFDKCNKEYANDLINILNEQEERIKEYEKELKRCREWINSDKNDYEVTLAFIKNKGFSLQDVLNYEKTLKK